MPRSLRPRARHRLVGRHAMQNGAESGPIYLGTARDGLLSDPPPSPANDDAYKRLPAQPLRMNAGDFLDRIRDDNETALSRLGSSKALYALTDGEMEGDAVLTAAADGAHAAAETLEEWADESAADAFGEAAAAERDHYETLAGKLDDYEASGTAAIQVYLRGLDDDVARLGGLVGAALAEKKRATQMSGFFTGEADPQTASLFRGYGSDLEGRWSEGLDALDDTCESDDDWERAAEAASAAIQAAYDDYVEKLEAMGVNPKPVC